MQCHPARALHPTVASISRNERAAGIVRPMARPALTGTTPALTGVTPPLTGATPPLAGTRPALTGLTG